MVTYHFILTFADGHKQFRECNVDPLVWSYAQVVESLKKIEGVTAIEQSKDLAH